MELHQPTTATADHPCRAGRSLSDIGLMDYNAWFYDPLLGRFTSPDSIVQDMENIADFNKYSYVRNSPIIYSDPSGNMIACLIDAGDCAGTGTGGLTPDQILEVSTNDYFTTMAICNYSITHPEYNTYFDEDLADAEKAIVSGAIFSGQMENFFRKSFKERMQTSFSQLLSGHGVEFITFAFVVGGIPDNSGNQIPSNTKSSTSIANGVHVYENIDDGLNFAVTPARHMNESSRRVPVRILQDALKSL
jgi:RHS repeat-associated protein